jgi:ribonuclease Z
VNFYVTILGSGAALPTSQRNPTSQYVMCNNRHILIDCGEGTQNQLRKHSVKIQQISHILISHLHGDHFFGLVGLLSTMHLMGRTKGVTIYGPEELEKIIRMQLEIGYAKIDFDVQYVKLDGKKAHLLFEDRLIEIHTFPLKHRIPTNGFLIKEKIKERRLNTTAFNASGLKIEHIPLLKSGKNVVDSEGKTHDALEYTYPPKPSYSYAYCSDTSYYEAIVPHIKNATVLYHEATFIEKDSNRAKATFHSTPRQAATIAKLAEVKHLFLGHLSARYGETYTHKQEASAVFNPVEVVEDGMQIIIE